MLLRELFDEALFLEAVDGGLVSARHHPTEPLVIYNYTKQCQWQRAWNNCTSQCRGLIATLQAPRDEIPVDEVLPYLDGGVVARPFPKFFNHGEPGAPAIPLDAPVRVTDKLDGSLGVLYPRADGYAIATRGSFESEQAGQATVMLQDHIADGFQPLEGFTYLFEIIYPENRIVVDYGHVRDLHLLAVIETATGLEMLGESHRDHGWQGPKVDVMPYQSFADALAAEPRPNAEGLVVAFDQGHHGFDRVKIKQDDYVELHRLVTGLTARTVWEALGGGMTVAEIKEPLPEEFHAWVDGVADSLIFKREQIDWRARAVFADIKKSLPEGWTRKDFALAAQADQYADIRGYLFTLLDDKDPYDKIWQSIRPEAFQTPRDFSEDVA